MRKFDRAGMQNQVPSDPHNGDISFPVLCQILVRATDPVPTEVNLSTDLPVGDKCQDRKGTELDLLFHAVFPVGMEEHPTNCWFIELNRGNPCAISEDSHTRNNFLF